MDVRISGPSLCAYKPHLSAAVFYRHSKRKISKFWMILYSMLWSFNRGTYYTFNTSNGSVGIATSCGQENRRIRVRIRAEITDFSILQNLWNPCVSSQLFIRQVQQVDGAPAAGARRPGIEANQSPNLWKGQKKWRFCKAHEISPRPSGKGRLQEM